MPKPRPTGSLSGGRPKNLAIRMAFTELNSTLSQCNDCGVSVRNRIDCLTSHRKSFRCIKHQKSGKESRRTVIADIASETRELHSQTKGKVATSKTCTSISTLFGVPSRNNVSGTKNSDRSNVSAMPIVNKVPAPSTSFLAQNSDLNLSLMSIDDDLCIENTKKTSNKDALSDTQMGFLLNDSICSNISATGNIPSQTKRKLEFFACKTKAGSVSTTVTSTPFAVPSPINVSAFPSPSNVSTAPSTSSLDSDFDIPSLSNGGLNIEAGSVSTTVTSTPLAVPRPINVSAFPSSSNVSTAPSTSSLDSDFDILSLSNGGLNIEAGSVSTTVTSTPFAVPSTINVSAFPSPSNVSTAPSTSSLDSNFDIPSLSNGGLNIESLARGTSTPQKNSMLGAEVIDFDEEDDIVVELVDEDMESTEDATHGTATVVNSIKSKKKNQIQPKIDRVLIKTNHHQLSKIKKAWRKFFYANRLPFRLADNPYFREAIEMTRPGLPGPILTRKTLAERHLDEEVEDLEAVMAKKLCKKFVTIAQDGFSNVHNQPIVATTLTTEEGETYPLTYEHVGSETKTAEFCAEKAKAAITLAETQYKCVVVAFVSDNENKMKKVREILRKWSIDNRRTELFVQGCGAHYMNLVGRDVPARIMSQIVDVQKLFRDKHFLKGELEKQNGCAPQIPNETRWLSQRATVQTFVKNYNIYWDIMVDNKEFFNSEIRQFLNCRENVVDAKNLLRSLDEIAKAINCLQSDKKNLSDSVKVWLELIHSKDLPIETARAVQKRFEQWLEPQAAIAYNLDTRRDSSWPKLSNEQTNAGDKYLEEKNPAFAETLVLYEVEDRSVFPPIAFNRTVKHSEKISQVQYWSMVESKTSTKEPNAKKFCRLMKQIFMLPSSSAGIERFFSLVGLTHNKIRNKLANERVHKLVKVTQGLRLHSKEQIEEIEGIDEIYEMCSA